MYKYKLRNGHTKASMIATLLKYNNGTRALAGTTCLFEARNGNRCAVGCFIPDNHRGLKYEEGAKGLLEAYPDLKSHMPLSSSALLKLQRVHDTEDGSTKSLRERMIEWVEKSTRES